jgi:hypothetical protein
MLARDRSTEHAGKREELGARPARRLLTGGVVARDEERRVKIAVARVPPAQPDEPVPPPGLDCPADGVGKPLDRDRDVLADVAALRSRDGEEDAEAATT